MKFFIFAILAILPYWAQAQDSCLKTCVINAECGIGGVCDQGQCRSQKSYCFNERWSVNDRGETNNCDAYTCSMDTGLCLRSAKSAQDCLSGYVFDGASACIPSVQCNLADPACQSLFERWKISRTEYEATTPEPQVAPLSCLPCETSQSCGSGKMCWQGRCTLESAFCSQDTAGEHFSQEGEGVKKSCGNFACEKVTGLCQTSCLKNADCRSGKMCSNGSCL